MTRPRRLRTYLPWIGNRRTVALRPIQIIGGRTWSLLIATGIDKAPPEKARAALLEHLLRQTHHASGGHCPVCPGGHSAEQGDCKHRPRYCHGCKGAWPCAIAVEAGIPDSRTPDREL